MNDDTTRTIIDEELGYASIDVLTPYEPGTINEHNEGHLIIGANGAVLTLANVTGNHPYTEHASIYVYAEYDSVYDFTSPTVQPTIWGGAANPGGARDIIRFWHQRHYQQPQQPQPPADPEPNVYIVDSPATLKALGPARNRRRPAVYLGPSTRPDGTATKRLGRHNGFTYPGYSRVLDIERGEERSIRNDCIEVAR